MIAQSHIPYYAGIFSIPGFLRDPVLVFGHNDCSFPGLPGFSRRLMEKAWLAFDHWRYRASGNYMFRYQADVPKEFNQASLHEILPKFGVTSITTLDLFDPRAELRHDMNLPVPTEYHDRFSTVIDIGNLEHVFDTKQCLTNMFRMLREGGHFLLHTPCSGYFNHGLHTFSPECILQAFERNGFEIVYLAYSTPTGVKLQRPTRACEAILWVVGRKVRAFGEFECPQQGRWEARYRRMAGDEAQPPPSGKS
jgi:SAM-dependent methyltransferase